MEMYYCGKGVVMEDLKEMNGNVFVLWRVNVKEKEMIINAIVTIL
jgi:hypothetical protein